MEQGQSRFLGSPGSFLYVRLHGGDVGALFLEKGERPTRYCAYAEPEVVLRGRCTFMV